MPTITLKLSGRQSLVAQIERKVEAFNKKADAIAQKASEDMESEAKARCPVRTKRLKKSIKKRKLARLKHSVGTDVEYAGHVNFGHRTRKEGVTVAANSFFTGAYLVTKKSFIRDLKAIKV